MSEEQDPLEERDQNEASVREARLLESMTEEQRMAKLATLLQNEDVRDLLWFILDSWCGIYSDPMNANFGVVAYGLGKAAIGKQLLLLINDADPRAWRLMQEKEFQRRAAELKAEALKKLRRGRSREATP